MGPQVGLTVACVLRSGGVYDATHVAGLRAQAAHWLPEAQFVCLSDVPVDCERVTMEQGWPGWWSKIELFQHFKGQTLYVDLDSVIVADPAPLVADAFTMCRNWIRPELLTSAVMSWNGNYSHIADAFAPVADQVMRDYVTCEQWGDQAWIAERAGDVRGFAPGLVESFRLQIQKRRKTMPSEGVRVVAFNREVPPWDGPDWARRWWQ